MSNLDRFKSDLARVRSTALEMKLDLLYRAMQKENKLPPDKAEGAKKIFQSFERKYQGWYTEAHAVIKQLLPDRLAEFVALYQPDLKRKEVNALNYRIQDWLNGTRSAKDPLHNRQYFADFSITSMNFNTQFEILESVQSRFESSLHDIRQLVRAELFDSELDAARELAAKGFLRGAGAVAGVVLEKHLGQVCRNHNLVAKKQHPTISEFNDMLKAGSAIDIPQWRHIQRLGDIRNLCDHNKDRPPKAEEVAELIDGVDKAAKTLF
jgi:hypothetical protein